MYIPVGWVTRLYGRVVSFERLRAVHYGIIAKRSGVSSTMNVNSRNTEVHRYVRLWTWFIQDISLMILRMLLIRSIYTMIAESQRIALRLR